MLCLIFIVGGLLIMMGQHDRSEALFYYFRLEDHIPESHLLRLIDKHISFEFVRQQLKDSYSETGRPSIDPELLLRILLIGYLYGITSERKLVDELRMHVAWRWFTGLGFDQEIPHHSTFSKNRHGRFQESKLFEDLFAQIVRQCVEVGLVQGKHLSVDGSFVEANAAKESRIPREQLAEAAQVSQTVRQYLVELEQQNPTEEPVHQQDQVSTTDPDSTYATKGGTPARLGVESRTGAVTVVSRWLIDWAFASSPQSGLAWSCFLFPLIEPDRQFSRIRLSEKTHAFAHGRFAVRCGNWTKPYTEFRDASGKRLYAGRGSLCLSHNHRRSLQRACMSTAL